MQTLTAHYQIVTPMFIGGANRDDTPEIRPPSIKGALRFWWRALHWGECLQHADNDANKALHLLYQQEAELFGAAFRDKQYGQGKILLKVKKLPEKQAKIKAPSPGQQYLLGQGLYHFRDGLLRTALDSNQTFILELKLDNEVDVQPVINTIMLFGLLGGLGSRARKGWGSVAIQSLVYTDTKKNKHTIAVPTDKASYKKAITEILSQLPDKSPPFTAFSKQTRIDLSLSGLSPDSLLTAIGNEQQMYRSYGRNAGDGYKVNGKEAEQNFKGDHDLVFDFAHGGTVKTYPKRVIFGLPHNYYFSDKTKVDIDAESEQGQSSRRASPLMIHIHQFSSGESIAIQSLMKAAFLPQNKKVELKTGAKIQKVPCHVEWTVVENYLDRFKEREQML